MNIFSNNKRKIGLAIGALALMLPLTACMDEVKPNTAQGEGQKQTETAFKQQSDAVPYPVAQLKDSQERRNIKERLLRTNKPNLLGYVYVMNYGNIVGYYAVKGKVSSNGSQMTTDSLVIDGCPGGGDGRCPTVVNAPGDDGSYGPNEDGVFFFTTEGAYVATNLDYIYADQPLPIDVPRLNSKK
jgi:hypothetical protein